MQNHHLYVQRGVETAATGHLEQVVEHVLGRGSPFEEGVTLLLMSPPTGWISAGGAGGGRVSTTKLRVSEVFGFSAMSLATTCHW